MYALKAKAGFPILKCYLKKHTAETVSDPQSKNIYSVMFCKNLKIFTLSSFAKKSLLTPDVNKLSFMPCLFVIKEMHNDSDFGLVEFKPQLFNFCYLSQVT